MKMNLLAIDETDAASSPRQVLFIASRVATGYENTTNVRQSFHSGFSNKYKRLRAEPPYWIYLQA